MANFTKTMAMEANKYDWKSTTVGLSDTEKRQFKKITEIGFSAVNDTAKIETVSLNLYNVFAVIAIDSNYMSALIDTLHNTVHTNINRRRRGRDRMVVGL
jgi:hypothetical protein